MKNGLRMEGILSKLSGIRQVKERYFRLRMKSNNCTVMEKYKDKDDMYVRDTYEIHEDCEVKYSERTGAYWFSIKTKKVVLKFGAPTMLERMHWIKGIERCIAEMKGEEGEMEHITGSASLGDVDPSVDSSKKNISLKLEIDGLCQEMRGKRGIRRKTHYFEYQNVKNSFAGSAVVDWLLKYHFSQNRSHAVEIGKELMKAGKLARVDGSRVFMGDDNVLYVFPKADGHSTSALAKDIDMLTERVQKLSLEIHQVENSSEELYDMLQEQISLLKKETNGMRQHIDWLTAIALSVSCGTFVIVLWGNFSQVPVVIRGFMLLLMLAVTFLGIMLVTSNNNPGLMLKLKKRFQAARSRQHAQFQAPKLTNFQSPLEKDKLSPRQKRSSTEAPKRLKPILIDNPLSGDLTENSKSSRAHSDPSPSPNGTSLERKRSSTKGGKKIDISWRFDGKGVMYRHFSEAESKDCWSQPDSKSFKVRGSKYLIDGVKVKSEESRFMTACCEMCGVGEKIDHIASLKHSALHRLRKEADLPKGSHPFPINFLIIQFQLPGISFTMYMQTRKGQDPNSEVCPGYTRLVNEFVNGSDDFRNSRFKILPTVVVGGWIVRKMVGAKPALLGRKISCTYHRGEDYLEVDVDIASSYVAQKILGVVQGYCKTLQVDLGFLIEGREEKELPEVMLGAVRFHHVDLSKIPPLKVREPANEVPSPQETGGPEPEDDFSNRDLKRQNSEPTVF